MNHFNNIFKKVFSGNKNMKYLQGNAFAVIDDNKVMKAEFITKGTSDQYEAIKVSVLHKDEGLIDRIEINFNDVLQTNGEGNPRIYDFGDEIVWYTWPPGQKAEISRGFGLRGKEPTPEELKNIDSIIKEYAEMFKTQTMENIQGNDIGINM